LDVGQLADYNALAVLERTDDIPAGADPETTAPVANYCVRHLKRWPLSTPYTRVVSDVRGLLERPPLPGCDLCVDATGIGRAVIDMFRKAEPRTRLTPVTITAATVAGAHAHRDGWSVPKKELVGVLQALQQQGRLKVSESPLRETYLQEFRTFKARVNAQTAYEQLAAENQDHDDLLIAAALPCWLAERQGARITPRVLPFRNHYREGVQITRPRIVVTSWHDLPALALAQQLTLLYLLGDPTPPREPPAEPPGHALGRCLDTLRLDFLDATPEDHAAAWERPLQPWGKPPRELLLTGDQARKIVAFTRRKRDERAGIYVIADQSPGLRRATSLAFALSDLLGLRRGESICRAGDRDWKAGPKDGAPLPHVYGSIMLARGQVV
jgi:hypothetical protein